MMSSPVDEILPKEDEGENQKENGNSKGGEKNPNPKKEPQQTKQSQSNIEESGDKEQQTEQNGNESNLEPDAKRAKKDEANQDPDPGDTSKPINTPPMWSEAELQAVALRRAKAELMMQADNDQNDTDMPVHPEQAAKLKVLQQQKLLTHMMDAVPGTCPTDRRQAVLKAVVAEAVAASTVVASTPTTPRNGVGKQLNVSSGPLAASTPNTPVPVQLGSFIDPLAKEGFTCTLLGAPPSMLVRPGEDGLTYLNRDHFYHLQLEYTPSARCPLPKSNVVTSVVALQFRERKTPEEARQHWDFWHGRQATPGLRLLDCEVARCSGLVESPKEMAHNAVAVRWHPVEGSAKVSLALRCLSTDFTAQKGVKGIPMHIQVDTYDERENCLHDRAFLQVETFCDKGAERKAREEEKRLQRAHAAGSNASLPLPTVPSVSLFQRALDLAAPMMFYTPNVNSQNKPSKQQGKRTPRTPAAKHNNNVPERILFYARQAHEDVYTPFHVVPPTVLGLIAAVSSKYQINQSDIRFVYKQNSRGIVVSMDDDMVRFYSHGEIFIMKVLISPEQRGGGDSNTLYDLLFFETKDDAPVTRSAAVTITPSKVTAVSDVNNGMVMM